MELENSQTLENNIWLQEQRDSSMTIIAEEPDQEERGTIVMPKRHKKTFKHK